MEEESRLSNASEPLPLRPGASWRTTLRLCMAIFFVAFVVYMISPVVTSFGTSGSVFVSASLIHEGNTNLDEYPEWLAQSPGFAENIRGSYYPRFSIGASAIAAPFVLVVDRALEPLCVVIPPLRRFLLGREPKPDEKVTATSVYSTTEKIVASAMTALSAVVLFFVFLRSLSIPYALVLVFTFAFCTSAWSFLTRALWSDGPSVLMLSLTLLLVVSSEKRPFLIQFASVPLAISYVVLPANAISVILLSLYVVLRHRRYFVYYLGWGVLAVVPFAMRNIAVYHTALPQYYLVGLRISADYLAGLAGALISPGRGLFVFCPVFLLCIYGIVMRIRSKQLNMLEKMICLILILHWAMISTTGAWRGGHCFGPRSFSDMLPYLMCFLIPVVRDIQTGGTARKIVLGGVYGILATISLAIHSTGAFSYHTVYWNATPQDISVARSRLWDWRDLQFLRPYAERRKAREALRAEIIARAVGLPATSGTLSSNRQAVFIPADMTRVNAEVSGDGGLVMFAGGKGIKLHYRAEKTTTYNVWVCAQHSKPGPIEIGVSVNDEMPAKLSFGRNDNSRDTQMCRLAMRRGANTIWLSFLNDYSGPEGDRNAIIYAVEIEYAQPRENER